MFTYIGQGLVRLLWKCTPCLLVTCATNNNILSKFKFGKTGSASLQQNVVLPSCFPIIDDEENDYMCIKNKSRQKLNFPSLRATVQIQTENLTNVLVKTAPPSMKSDMECTSQCNPNIVLSQIFLLLCTYKLRKFACWISACNPTVIDKAVLPRKKAMLACLHEHCNTCNITLHGFVLSDVNCWNFGSCSRKSICCCYENTHTAWGFYSSRLGQQHCWNDIKCHLFKAYCTIKMSHIT